MIHERGGLALGYANITQRSGVPNHTLKDFQMYRNWAVTPGDSDSTNEMQGLGITVMMDSPQQILQQPFQPGQELGTTAQVLAIFQHQGQGHTRWLSQKCLVTLPVGAGRGSLALLPFLVGGEKWELLTSSLSLVERKAHLLYGHCGSSLAGHEKLMEVGRRGSHQSRR